MDRLSQDVRYALRQLAHAPGFAFIIILTIALGVGSAAAVFSVVDAVILRPLPFAHQDRLVFPDTRSIIGWQQPWSLPSYLDTRAQLTTFQALAGYNSFTRINLEGPSGPVSLPVVKGTDNFFTVFGVKPLLGRTYLPGEDQPGKDNVAVLSYEVWQRHFNSKTSVIGTAVRLDGIPYTVIGVMPPGFRFPLQIMNAVYTPLHPDPAYIHNRASHWMLTVGLLKEDSSLQKAQAEFNLVFNSLANSYPEVETGRIVRVIPLNNAISSQVYAPLKTLVFAVLALLGIACVNVAGLLLARGVRREKEMALRAAIGASRNRMLRQMFTESIVLSIFGLLCGVGIAYTLIATMKTYLIEALARGVDVHMNLLALGIAVVLSGITSIGASLAPSLRLSSANPNGVLRSGGAAGSSRGQQHLRSGFVIIQVALSLVLLVVSTLLLRNLDALLNVPLGYPADKILTTQIALSPGRYSNQDPLATLYQPLIERIYHLPGVTSVGIINILPIQNYGNNQNVHIAGQPPYPARVNATAEIRFVSSGYFDVMGIHLNQGRMLSQALDPYQNPAGTVVVNQAFVHSFFANSGNPVGAQLDDNEKPELKTTIVGATSDIRQDIRQTPLPETDWLVSEYPPKDRLSIMSNMTLVLRSDQDPQQLVGSVKNALHEIDPTIPFREPETMAQIVSESLVFDRLENWLFGIFAGFALLLATIGIYGLIQHEVNLHMRDIGVRMALGSTRSRVASDILVRVTWLMVAGVALGWSIALLLRKILGAITQLDMAHDFTLLSGLTVILIVIGLAASVLPAIRAASIDPMEALRAE